MRDRGFALLEVIVAAALLVALAAGVSRIVAAAIREGLASRLRAVATIAAADKSEELRSLPLTDLMSGGDYLDGAGESIGSGPALPRSAVYTRRWTVQAVDSDPEVFALCVEVFLRDGSLTARVTTLRAGR
jgi:prepilin-type N-terminal cleavage/methylation domain-containing protein